MKAFSLENKTKNLPTRNSKWNTGIGSEKHNSCFIGLTYVWDIGSQHVIRSWKTQLYRILSLQEYALMQLSLNNFLQPIATINYLVLKLINVWTNFTLCMNAVALKNDELSVIVFKKWMPVNFILGMKIWNEYKAKCKIRGESYNNYTQCLQKCKSQ